MLNADVQLKFISTFSLSFANDKIVYAKPSESRDRKILNILNYRKFESWTPGTFKALCLFGCLFHGIDSPYKLALFINNYDDSKFAHFTHDIKNMKEKIKQDETFMNSIQNDWEADDIVRLFSSRKISWFTAYKHCQGKEVTGIVNVLTLKRIRVSALLSKLDDYLNSF